MNVNLSSFPLIMPTQIKRSTIRYSHLLVSSSYSSCYLHCPFSPPGAPFFSNIDFSIPI